MWDNYCMPLPENITVGDTVYTVRREVPDGKNAHGEFCAATQTLSICPAVSFSYERYLLTHELVHAMFEHSGACTDEDGEKFSEEQVACIVGRALPALLKRNPKLVEYLTQ